MTDFFDRVVRLRYLNYETYGLSDAFTRHVAQMVHILSYNSYSTSTHSASARYLQQSSPIVSVPSLFSFRTQQRTFFGWGFSYSFTIGDVTSFENIIYNMCNTLRNARPVAPGYYTFDRLLKMASQKYASIDIGRLNAIPELMNSYFSSIIASILTHPIVLIEYILLYFGILIPRSYEYSYDPQRFEQNTNLRGSIYDTSFVLDRDTFFVYYYNALYSSNFVNRNWFIKNRQFIGELYGPGGSFYLDTWQNDIPIADRILGKYTYLFPNFFNSLHRVNNW